MPNLLNLTEKDVANVLRYADLVPLMRDTLISFTQGKAHQPVRNMMVIEPDQRFLGVMPAATPAAMGAKLVSFYPKNAGSEHHTHQASILLFDPEFGTPLATIDGRLITEMRTAATSVAVTQVAANPNSRVLALLGSGVQASAHLAALRESYDLTDVRIWSRNAVHAEQFALAHDANAMAASAAVQGADIVVCATNALEPILRGRWLKTGAHVNSVGSPRPTWRELDNDTMTNTVIVDSVEAANQEAGDVILSGASVYAEAGEILSGAKSIDANQTTVFKSVGIAVEDLATARWVYDKHLALAG